ncbi:hypothetical protein Dimus_010639, partial [Dionaea muscipula]
MSFVHDSELGFCLVDYSFCLVDYRQGPPSPGTRPRRHRSPSPLISSSTDPDEVSSSEEEDASEVVVTASEVEDKSDLEAAWLILSQAPDLSPILEDDGKHGASGSSMSGSPVLLPTAAVLACQAVIVAVEQGLVSLLSSSLLDAVVSGECSSPVLAGTVLGSDFDVPTEFGVGDALTVEGGLVDCGDEQVASDGLDVPPTLKAGEVVLPATVNVFPSHSTILCDDVASFGGGKVSEEMPSAPVAREAVRPQPTDGLRLPLLTSVALQEGSMSA